MEKNEYWLICNTCGYSKKVYSKEEIMDNDICPLCQNTLIWDMNAGRKLELEPIGDNFPKYGSNFPDQNMIYNKECIFYGYSKEKCDRQGECDNCPHKTTDKIREINNAEQEIVNSIKMIGDCSTWEMIEAVADPKMRLRFRLIFLKLGSKIPEKGE